MSEGLRKWATRGLFAGSAAGFISGGILNSEGLEVAKEALEKNGLPVTHENILKFLHENPDNLVHLGINSLLFVSPELFVAGLLVSTPGLTSTLGELIGGIFSFGTRRQSVAAATGIGLAVTAGPQVVHAVGSAHEGLLNALVNSL